MKVIQGNVLDIKSGIITHGVNCMGMMNAGIARQIREKWPIVYKSYLKIEPGAENLGRVQIVKINQILTDKPPLEVANCWTQVYFGSGKAPYNNADHHASYEAINTCLKKVMEYAKENKTTVHLPKIGCGLGGADWNLVSKMIELLQIEVGLIDGVYHWDLSI